MSKREGAPCLLTPYKRSSIGRAAVSKTAGRGFDSYRLCKVHAQQALYEAEFSDDIFVGRPKP
jgi:hypothetical protein